jgi:hypothetical protein
LQSLNKIKAANIPVLAFAKNFGAYRFGKA